MLFFSLIVKKPTTIIPYFQRLYAITCFHLNTDPKSFACAISFNVVRTLTYNYQLSNIIHRRDLDEFG